MNIKNLTLGVNSITISYFIRYENLLQNVTVNITKYDSYFITKCNRSLLQNTSGFLLQNATVLLQNETLQIATVHYYNYFISSFKFMALHL